MMGLSFNIIFPKSEEWALTKFPIYGLYQWYSILYVRVTPDAISLQLGSPEGYIVYNLHPKEIKYIT
jgi:hypothetical protein